MHDSSRVTVGKFQTGLEEQIDDGRVNYKKEGGRLL
jgi:hypothetical protein